MIETMVLHRRHAGRYQQIVRTLIAHGMGSLVAPFDVRGRSSRSTVDSPTRPVHVRLALEELGPTFVKLGQLLSTRADVIPPDYIAELEHLQDNVRPEPAPAIIAVIEEELGARIKDVFASFEHDPIASASIGQVHLATRHDGRQMAVKVQRPNVQRQINEDLQILADIARVAENRSKTARQHRVTDLVREFSFTLRQELDYQNEARNMERFARGFADDSRLRIPAVDTSLSTSRVLTMEYVEGLSLSNVGAIRDEGIDVESLVDGVILMLASGILDIGLFHADPHPGNFAVDSNGALVVYDFGMVGTLDDRLQETLLLMVAAVAEKDSTRVVDGLLPLGAVPSGFDRHALERDVSRLMSQYVGVPLDSLPLPMIIGDIMDMMRRHHLRLPADLALLLKTAVMAESIARTLDPRVNVIELVEPVLRRGMERFATMGYWKERLRSRPLEIAFLASSAPSQVQRLFNRLDRNDLGFRIHVDEMSETLRTLEMLVNRLSMSILTAAGVIALGMLYSAFRPRLLSLGGLSLVVLAIPVIAVIASVVWGMMRGGGGGRT